jgi:predicted MPP superfamily phosphohydrolase
MQFGIEIPGYFKWSLAQYVQTWAGFENMGRYVYVNRGFGFHAIRRVGIMPEITVIELALVWHNSF